MPDDNDNDGGDGRDDLSSTKNSFNENKGNVTAASIQTDNDLSTETENVENDQISKENESIGQHDEALIGSGRAELHLQDYSQQIGSIVVDENNNSSVKPDTNIDYLNEPTTESKIGDQNQDDPAGSMSENLLAEIKIENEELRTAIQKLNLRLGDEIVSDDSITSLVSDCEMPENGVNTREFAIDHQFADKYYFITNWRGDRYYLDYEVKLTLSTVTTLKKMNTTYPKTSSDFDNLFLFYLLKAIFKKEDLQATGKSSSIKSLNRAKLQLAKAIFAVRVGEDKKRFNNFREIAIEIGHSLNQNQSYEDRR